MNRFQLLIFALIVFFHSCSNNKKSKPDEKTTKNDSVTIKNSIAPNDDAVFNDKKEELEKLTPLKVTDLEKLLPAELMGAPRTEMESMEYAGTNMVSANYQLNEQSDISLTIVDCGGPAGAGLYGVQFLEFLGKDMNENGEYTKTVNLNGTKALEHCDQKADDCSIIWFAGKRFLVTLEADGASLETLKQASRAIRL